MSRKIMVIDTSAILAELKDEPGAEVVRKILAIPPEGGFYMHAVNVCEVAYHMIKFGIIEPIAYEMAIPEGVAIIEDVRPILWKRTASLKAQYKNLALGDCVAIALAETLDADILTGDRYFNQVDTKVEIKMFR